MHLRGHENIEKRLLIYGSAFNLSLVLQQVQSGVEQPHPPPVYTGSLTSPS